MQYYHYFYYILEHMQEYKIDSVDTVILYFLRYFHETNQEVDMEKMSTQLNIDLMEVANRIEKLLDAKLIDFSRKGDLQYNTNVIYDLKNQKQKQDQAHVFKKFETGFNRMITQKEVEKINELTNTYSLKLIEYALRETLLKNVKNIAYVEKILINWKKQNFTEEDYEKQH